MWEVRPGRGVEGYHAFGILLLEQLLRVSKAWPRPYKAHRVLESWVVPAAARLLGAKEEELLRLTWGDFLVRLGSLDVAEGDREGALVRTAAWLGSLVSAERAATLADVLRELKGRARYSGSDGLARKYLGLFRELGFDRAWRRALEELAAGWGQAPGPELVCAGLPPSFFAVVGVVRRLSGPMSLLEDDFRVFYGVVTNCQERGYGRVWDAPVPRELAERIRGEEYRSVRLRLSRDFPETVDLLDRWMGVWAGARREVTVDDLLRSPEFVTAVKDLVGRIRERTVDGLGTGGMG